MYFITFFKRDSKNILQWSYKERIGTKTSQYAAPSIHCDTGEFRFLRILIKHLNAGQCKIAFTGFLLDSKPKRGRLLVTWRSTLKKNYSLINSNWNTVEYKAVNGKTCKSLKSLCVIRYGKAFSTYSIINYVNVSNLISKQVNETV